MTYTSFKRVLDVLAALIGLVAFAPVMLICAALIFITMGRPVLFLQSRPGKDERLFTLVKFRTMSNNALLSDAQRLTVIGKLLRRTSLDELPCLVNVLRGDMSLVGPRPLLPEYLPLYTPEQRKRHSVRPGVTGLAQIMGRNGVPFEQRFAFDVYYVQHYSLTLDIKILFKTIFIVLSQKGTHTQERYRG